MSPSPASHFIRILTCITLIVRLDHPPASSARVSVLQFSSVHFMPDPPPLLVSDDINVCTETYTYLHIIKTDTRSQRSLSLLSLVVNRSESGICLELVYHWVPEHVQNKCLFI
ncbi:hypothetical protein AG1IA_03661 [Rhizoctonia solani AG-1 IA]|uniref:Uncharacterized protein n=1 Tax=Thanatephorus cucumeris (strain AG1-IA) TaxID=983506 RepID=L8WW73_THACA|nr:hypothetical protein AG1IA_03661 [Rhizoctonia solani AG-1 IA]